MPPEWVLWESGLSFGWRVEGGERREDVAPGYQACECISEAVVSHHRFSSAPQVSRLARLSLIAEELGLPDLANKSDRLIRHPGFTNGLGGARPTCKPK